MEKIYYFYLILAILGPVCAIFFTFGDQKSDLVLGSRSILVVLGWAAIDYSGSAVAILVVLVLAIDPRCLGLLFSFHFLFTLA